MATIFQKIINREIPADFVYEDDEICAFRDINPQAPIHILVIPKKEILSTTCLVDEDRELVGHLILTAAEIARGEGLDGNGYRLVINSGPHGGQSVDHLHVHILGGRAMGWPPG